MKRVCQSAGLLGSVLCSHHDYKSNNVGGGAAAAAAAAATQREVDLRLRRKTGMQGSVLYSNYGYKSDEELILGYGFALENNPANFFHVMIGLADRPSAGGCQLRLCEQGCASVGMCCMYTS